MSNRGIDVVAAAADDDSDCYSRPIDVSISIIQVMETSDIGLATTCLKTSWEY